MLIRRQDDRKRFDIWVLCVCPETQQIVIDTCQFYQGRVFGNIRREPLYNGVKLKQHSPLSIIPDHTLDPEERR